MVRYHATSIENVTNTFLNLRERQALIDILRGTDVRERAKKINLSVSRVYCMRVDVCRKFGVNSAHALRSILIKELKGSNGICIHPPLPE